MSDESLLNVLEGKESLIETTDVVNFCLYFNIEPGRTDVPKRALYKLYKTWSVTPYPIDKWAAEISLYIPYISSRKVFCLAKTKLDVQKSILELIEKKKKSDPYVKLKNKKYRDHFQIFLKEVTVNPGTNWINIDCIKFIYDRWYYNKKKKQAPLGRAAIFELFKNNGFVTHSDIAVGRLLVRLDDTIFKEMTSSQMLDFIESLQRKRNVKKKKKQVPRPPTGIKS